MITFKELTIRNFLSYGNNTTTIKLDFDAATLIVGRNYDSIVNGQVDSNGSGKSSILNAISFCLYDKTISNIEKSDVVNYINGKNMELSLTLNKDGVYYKIERYRKNKAKGGDGVRVFVNPKDCVFGKEHDKTPDSIANANKELEKILGIPFDIFARIVVFSASFEPFLSLPSSHTSKANQRDIIEELFGLTELSRKAETLKTVISETKARLKQESENNDRINAERSRYESRLQSTQIKLLEWESNRKTELKSIKNKLKEYVEIDIDFIENVLQEYKSLSTTNDKLKTELRFLEKELESVVRNNKKVVEWESNQKNKIKRLEETYSELSSYDVKYLNEVKSNIEKLSVEIKQLRSNIATNKSKKSTIEKNLNNLVSEVDQLEDSKCPYCKQRFHDAEAKIQECKHNISNIQVELDKVNSDIYNDEALVESIEKKLNPLLEVDIPVNLKSIEQDLISVGTQLNDCKNQENPFQKMDSFAIDAKIMDITQEIEINSAEMKKKIESLDHSQTHLIGGGLWSESNLEKLKRRIENDTENYTKIKSQDNPFTSVVSELQFTLDNEIKQPDTKVIDSLYSELEHQEFLLKLLTKKDSFVRKALLNKNIPFLNSRLSYYLESIGMNHKVLFTEEMGAKITQFGTEYSFHNLSAGQKARINLALSFAFRDVLQARFSKINFCILDECLDVGLGNVGVQLAAKMIKKIATTDKLSMFIISHRDEISAMFDSKLEIELRNGFSNVVQSKLSSTTSDDEV